MDNRIAQRVLWELIKSFFWQMTAYVCAVLFAAGCAYMYCRSRIWYGTEPLYPLVHYVHDQWWSVFLSCVLFGCIVIPLLNFWRVARQMAQIVGAVGSISRENAKNIVLPPQLHEVESQLNGMLRELLTSRAAEREAVRRKNDMIVYLAHDLKTPLTSVLGYLTLLSDEEQISEPLKQKYIGIALGKAQRLEDLINEFFEVTKYNFTHMELTLSNVNLSMMLTQLLYEFEPMFAKKGLTLQTDIAPQQMYCCDVDKLARVFDNLFKNVVSYCYKNTQVSVSLRRGGQGNVVIKVKNAGQTIPPEKLSHLFEQFFRLDASRGTDTGGSGLGLAIAKEIITLHRGTITCESADETVVFTIVLP